MILNPLLSKLLGSVVRSALVALGGYLSAQAVANPEQISAFVEASLPIVVGLAWSFYQKYSATQKQLTAQAMAGVTEHQVEAKIESGSAPSVTTPKNEAPALITPEFRGTAK